MAQLAAFTTKMMKMRMMMTELRALYSLHCPRALNMVLELTLLPTDYHEEACNYLNDWQLPAVPLCSCVSHADEIFSAHLSAYS
mmetsp:Transcript_20991/g.35034  ORF Transcript_20991/g.35034 Transcript_20991/m.35034 type:complete len:84 (+) Transcript_20991:451-702(+)